MMRIWGNILLVVGLLILSFTPAVHVTAQVETPVMTITEVGFLTPGQPEVTARVSVVGADGGFVSGLTAADFSAFEDDRAVPSAELAVSEDTLGSATVIVVDTGANITTRKGVTSSTRWGDLHDVSDDRAANGLVNELVKHRLNQPEDWIGFVGVAQTVTQTVPPERDQNKVLNALTEMLPHRGPTPLRAGIDQALRWLEADTIPAHIRKNIVVFSDGIDVTKNPDEFIDLINRAKAAGVTFYTIGMASPNSTTGYEATGLERLAKQTNGAFIQHNSPEQREAALRLFDQIVTQRQQYRLTYQTHAGQGQHQLRLEVATSPDPAEDAAVFVSPIRMPTLKIAVSTDTIEKPGSVVITPAWQDVDGYPRDPSKIEYLQNGLVISTITGLAPFTWSTASLPNQEGVYALEARGYDSILLDAPPAMSNQEKIKVTITVPVKAVESVSQNWLVLILLGLVVVLLIIVVPNRKKITQTARATTQRLQVATRRLPTTGAARFKLIGLNLGQEYPLTEKIVRIGRDPSCSIPLNDLGVSMAHADLTEDQSGNYMIADLTSTNGTYVNGVRLPSGPTSGQPGQPTLLRPGDMIRVGAIELKFDYAKVTRRLPPGS